MATNYLGIGQTHELLERMIIRISKVDLQVFRKALVHFLDLCNRLMLQRSRKRTKLTSITQNKTNIIVALNFISYSNNECGARAFIQTYLSSFRNGGILTIAAD